MNRIVSTLTLVLLVSGIPVSIMASEKSKKNEQPKAAVVVGDTHISEEFLNYYAEQRKRQAPNAPEATRDQLIEDVINTALLANEFDKLGSGNTNPDFQFRVMYMKANALVQEQLAISDKEIEDLYNETVKSKGVESFNAMEYHTRHILLDDEKEANDVIKQIKDGADFSALAKQKSKDKGSGSSGGDIGWFKTDSLVPPYSDAMQKLKAGEMTDKPVKSQFGWHVIELMEKPRKASLPTLAEESPRLKGQLFTAKFTAYVNALKAKSKIVINPKEKPKGE